MLYRYFRWLDDVIDSRETSEKDKIEFLAQERSRIDDLYALPRMPAPDLPAQIVGYDRRHGNRLKSWIKLMFEVFEFDARRAGRVLGSDEIFDYSRRLAEAYTRLLINFIEPRYPYAAADARLAHACHLLHMLRDYEIDLGLGYINIGRDEADRYGFRIGEAGGEGFRRWLDDRLDMVDQIFKEGRSRILALPFARVKLIALLYCFRYKQVMQRVRRRGLSRTADHELRPADILRLIGEMSGLTARHLWQRMKLW
jgi:phytoene/squalene synthetase